MKITYDTSNAYWSGWITVASRLLNDNASASKAMKHQIILVGLYCVHPVVYRYISVYTD
jgi:hypothetical protein